MANQNPIGSATGTLANGSQNTTYTIYDSTLLQGGSATQVMLLWISCSGKGSI